jgi:hypothetical protein
MSQLWPLRGGALQGSFPFPSKVSEVWLFPLAHALMQVGCSQLQQSFCNHGGKAKCTKMTQVPMPLDSYTNTSSCYLWTYSVIGMNSYLQLSVACNQIHS